MASKRSYTVPVLLVILTGMAILLVMLYSKVLIAGQDKSTEEGEQLAAQYGQAVLFAERLHDAADQLLKDSSMQERLQAKSWLGEAKIASEPAGTIFSVASSRSYGESLEAASRPIVEAMARIMGREDGGIYGVAEHEGPLTEAEKAVLETVREGASAMRQALNGFRPPTLVAGYRQMAAGEGWVEPALAASGILVETAGKLNR